jgi:hypothetical protein
MKNISTQNHLKTCKAKENNNASQAACQAMHCKRHAGGSIIFSGNG